MRVYPRGEFSVLISIPPKYKELAVRVFAGLMW
jgi:hypothetical protein